MADTSYFDRFFNSENNPAIESLKGLPSGILDTLNGLDADTLEYLESLERDNTIPLTMKDQIGQRLGNIVPDFVDFGLDTGENIQKSIDEFLSGDSTTVSGLKDGSIKEGDVDLTGIDLVQVLGDNFGPSVPEEFKNVGPGQMNRFDPTGDNRSKSVELQKQIDALGTVGGRGEMVEGPEERANYIEKKRGEAAEAFRAQEKQLVDSQGGLNSMSIAESDSIVQDGFIAAMDDFFEGARGAGPEVPKKRTIAEYKKAFSEATGVDTSGKVDKSHALMAMGLALMQNKGGNIFTEIGIAGEKALPALEKAKAEAKRAGLAAGQYALQSRNSDQAKDEANVEKGKQRSAFYIVPKGKGVSGFLANIDQGQLENLNPFELDALMSNKSFQEKFDVVPGSTWSGIVEEAMKTPEAKSLYLTKNPNMISLIPGVENDLFTIKTFSADPNVEGNEGRSARLDGDGQETYKALAAAAQDLERAKAKFMEGFGLAESTSAFRFTLDKVDSLAGAFGINVDGQTNSTEKLKLFLTKLQAQNAKEILGEAGKTISDADRLLVQSIVGNVGVLTNPDVLAEKMSQLYNDIILKKEREIFAALETLDRYSGRKIASRLGGGELNSEEQAELDAAIAAIGE
mgnify:CR=1 FL=1